MGARFTLGGLAVMTSRAGSDGHGMVKGNTRFKRAGGAVAGFAGVAISDIGRAV